MYYVIEVQYQCSQYHISTYRDTNELKKYLLDSLGLQLTE